MKKRLTLLAGLLVIISCVSLYAVYFSNDPPWTNQPIPEGSTVVGPYALQYMGEECICYDADGNPKQEPGVQVVLVNESYTQDWCLCRDDGPPPDTDFDALKALLMQHPVGGPTAVYVHMNRPLGDPHAHIGYPHTNPPTPGPYVGPAVWR